MVSYTSKAQNNNNELPSSGDIGIGTMNPKKKMDVNGKAIFRDSLVFEKYGFSNSSGQSTPEFLPKNIRLLGIDKNGHLRVGKLRRPDGPGGGGGDIGLPFNCRVTHLFKARWDADKQALFPACNQTEVGIGTRDPQSKLHVNGNSFLDGNVGIETAAPQKKLHIHRPTNGVFAHFSDKHTGTSENDGFDIGLDKNGTGEAHLIQRHQNSKIKFKIRGKDKGSSIKTPLKIHNNGNVGVGITATPQHQLDVAGTMRACEILVKDKSWCDYVFEEDYNLMSIKELEEYINKYEHLPGIPKGEDIEKNGLSLGDMQKRMMEKIEEQALYIIEQNKEIEKLEKEQESLQAQVDAMKKKMNDESGWGNKLLYLLTGVLVVLAFVRKWKPTV